MLHDTIRPLLAHTWPRKNRVHLSNSTPSVSSLLSRARRPPRISKLSQSCSHARRGSILGISIPRLGERIFHETSSFYFRRLYSVSCAEFNHRAATIDLSRDTIEGGENGNYARGYICFSPSFASSTNLLLNFPLFLSLG